MIPKYKAEVGRSADNFTAELREYLVQEVTLGVPLREAVESTGMPWNRFVRRRTEVRKGRDINPKTVAFFRAVARAESKACNGLAYRW